MILEGGRIILYMYVYILVSFEVGIDHDGGEGEERVFV